MNNSAQINMNILERLFAGARVRLTNNRCGYLIDSTVLPFFEGHEHFNDRDRWYAHYAGPSFASDCAAAARMEERIDELDLVGQYISCIVPLLNPLWDRLQSDAEVISFWWSLVNAHPMDRAAAAVAMNPYIVGEQFSRRRTTGWWRSDRMREMVERSIELTLVETEETWDNNGVFPYWRDELLHEDVENLCAVALAIDMQREPMELRTGIQRERRGREQLIESFRGAGRGALLVQLEQTRAFIGRPTI